MDNEETVKYLKGKIGHLEGKIDGINMRWGIFQDYLFHIKMIEMEEEEIKRRIMDTIALMVIISFCVLSLTLACVSRILFYC